MTIKQEPVYAYAYPTQKLRKNETQIALFWEIYYHVYFNI